MLSNQPNLHLSDIGKELLNKGARVTVEFGGNSFTGAVVRAGEDYATLSGPGQIADVRLDAGKWSIVEGGMPGDPWPGGVETFAAVLHEHAESEANLRFVLGSGDLAIGKVAVVAADHVEIADVDGRRMFVPGGLLLGTIRSMDSH